MTLLAVVRAGLLAVALLAATRANAASSARVVEIHVQGDAQLAEQVRVVTTELLSQIGLSAVILSGERRAPSYSDSEEPFVRAYVDFRTRPATLIISDGATSQELERRSLPEGAAPEAAVESAAHVLLMVVESVLDRRAAAREAPAGTQPPASAAAPRETSETSARREARGTPALREPSETSTPSSPAPPGPVVPSRPEGALDQTRSDRGTDTAAASPIELDVGVLGRVLSLGEGRLLPGAGMGVDLGLLDAAVLFGVSGTFAAHVPMTIESEGATATLTPISVALNPTLGKRLGGAWSAFVGFGADWTWFSLATRGPRGVTRSRSAGGVDTTLYGLLGLRAHVTSRLSLTLRGALEYDPAPRTFTATAGTERRVLATLPALRPTMSLLCAYSLFDPSGPNSGARRP